MDLAAEMGVFGYLGDVGGESDERGAGIDCGAGVFQFEGFLTEGETIETDFPVSTASNGEPGDFTGIVVFIVSTEHSLSTIIRVLVVITKIERKHFVINQLPVNHKSM